MYIVNDICYADCRQDNLKVVEAKPFVGRMLLVTFSSGEKRLFDTTKITGSAFAALDTDKIFNNITLFHGVITWENGNIDIANETVYDMSIPYEEDFSDVI